jgi:hypothetical protein
MAGKPARSVLPGPARLVDVDQVLVDEPNQPQPGGVTEPLVRFLAGMSALISHQVVSRSFTRCQWPESAPLAERVQATGDDPDG